VPLLRSTNAVLIVRLADDANDGAEELANAVRQALDEAREALTQVASPRQINDLLRCMVGEFVIHGDGTVSAKEDVSVSGSQAPPPLATRHLSGIAGTIRRAFWAAFRDVAEPVALWRGTGILPVKTGANGSFSWHLAHGQDAHATLWWHGRYCWRRRSAMDAAFAGHFGSFRQECPAPDVIKRSSCAAGARVSPVATGDNP